MGDTWSNVILAWPESMFRTRAKLTLSCLAEDSAILTTLGSYLPYEVAVGINGRIWVKATTTENTILVANSILNSQHMTKEQIQAMVQTLLKQNKAR